MDKCLARCVEKNELIHTALERMEDDDSDMSHIL